MNIKNITNYVVRTDTINAFISEISKMPVMTGQEERDLFAKYEHETDEDKKIAIRNEIISRNLRFVYAVAKRYDYNDILPDLINTGMIGMYEAFQDYDWHSGNRFSTLAVWYIRRAINAYLNKENNIVRQKNGPRIIPKVKRIENDFFLINGRKPSTDEIVDILKKDFGIDADPVDVCGTRVDKIESCIGDDDDNTFDKSPAFNERTSTDNAFDETIEDDHNKFVVNEAMSVLNDREKKIVSMAFGYGYPREYKDKEIGEAIGLTSERVRQLRHGAVKKMRSAALAAVNA